MECFAFLLTILMGFLGSVFLGPLFNWTDAGAIIAIATVGSILLWAIKHLEHKDN